MWWVSSVPKPLKTIRRSLSKPSSPGLVRCRSSVLAPTKQPPRLSGATPAGMSSLSAMIREDSATPSLFLSSRRMILSLPVEGPNFEALFSICAPRSSGFTCGYVFDVATQRRPRVSQFMWTGFSSNGFSAKSVISRPGSTLKSGRGRGGSFFSWVSDLGSGGRVLGLPAEMPMALASALSTRGSNFGISTALRPCSPRRKPKM